MNPKQTAIAIAALDWLVELSVQNPTPRTKAEITNPMTPAIRAVLPIKLTTFAIKVPIDVGGLTVVVVPCENHGSSTQSILAVLTVQYADARATASTSFDFLPKQALAPLKKRFAENNVFFISFPFFNVLTCNVYENRPELIYIISSMIMLD